MADKAWKAAERSIAKSFGALRNSLSGGNSKLTKSDTTHPRLFIEVKWRVKHTAVTLWDKTKVLASGEGKRPVVALREKGRPGFWVLVHINDLRAVADELVEEVPDAESQ
jgi:hypothetical protein